MVSRDYRIHTPSRSVIVRYDPAVQKVIPHAKPVQHTNGRFLLIPHKHEETQILTNLDYPIPAPIKYYYDWNGTAPFASQQVTAAMLTANKRAYVLNDLGTGKTRAALYAADFLMREGLVTRALILAPLSTLTATWAREIFMCFPERESVVLHGSREKRIELLNDPTAEFFILNHDGVKVLFKEINNRKDIDLVIIDELAVFRNASTKRFKLLHELILDREYVWGMTGAPTPNEPTDAWAQMRLLTPARTTKYMSQFRDQTMIRVSNFRWIPRANAQSIVFGQMQPAVRFNREDCVDLPPVMYTKRSVDLSAEQNKLYKQLMKDYYAQWLGGEITAANAGVRMSKLLQVCCGFAYDDQHTARPIDARERLAAVEEIVEETSRKVIVFAPFRAAVDMVYEHLSRHVNCAKVHGDVSKTARDKIFSDFQQQDNPRVLIADPRTMAHGLTLTAANTIIWYAPFPSYEIYEQANARITRPGQTAKQLIAHIEAGDVERVIYSRLRHKGRMQDVLLDMFRNANGDVNALCSADSTRVERVEAAA